MRISDWSSDVCSSDLGGRDASVVRSLVMTPASSSVVLPSTLTKTSRLAPIPDVDSGAIIPEPPPLTLALPATILLGHPNVVAAEREAAARWRSEEHTSELQSLMRNSYAVFCLKKKKITQPPP